MGSCSRKKQQAGFTLVELMVALVIGLLVTAGAIQIFVMSKRAFQEMDALSDRQETLRFIVDVISLDIRTASTFEVENDNSSLRLSYNPSISEELSCGPGMRLKDVWYEFRDGSGEGEFELYVDYGCELEDPDESCPGGATPYANDTACKYSGHPVARGPENVIFSESGEFVVVSVAFPALHADEPEADRTFVFRSVRRSELINKLRFAPNMSDES